MFIGNKNFKFAFTVQAHKEISALCKDGNIENLGELYSGTTAENINVDIKLAIILNKAYEDMMVYYKKDYIPTYLTEKDFKYFQVPNFPELEKELTFCMQNDSTQEVEIQESKTPKKAK